jgi:hypothetical protein
MLKYSAYMHIFSLQGVNTVPGLAALRSMTSERRPPNEESSE